MLELAGYNDVTVTRAYRDDPATAANNVIMFVARKD
jgi:hypothetical protein